MFETELVGERPRFETELGADREQKIANPDFYRVWSIRLYCKKSFWSSSVRDEARWRTTSVRDEAHNSTETPVKTDRIETIIFYKAPAVSANRPSASRRPRPLVSAALIVPLQALSWPMSLRLSSEQISQIRRSEPTHKHRLR